eukprot:gb/GEZN01006401.1/.p1 GENE.gb/GEZN01006401.1/~~gb/GEZN01006401.1/.p1  ORF type:complete len:485 (-),score=12.72 gb/GEZN01006401.1/:129-1583(-)
MTIPTLWTLFSSVWAESAKAASPSFKANIMSDLEPCPVVHIETPHSDVCQGNWSLLGARDGKPTYTNSAGWFLYWYDTTTRDQYSGVWACGETLGSSTNHLQVSSTANSPDKIVELWERRTGLVWILDEAIYCTSTCSSLDSPINLAATWVQPLVLTLMLFFLCLPAWCISWQSGLLATLVISATAVEMIPFLLGMKTELYFSTFYVRNDWGDVVPRICFLRDQLSNSTLYENGEYMKMAYYPPLWQGVLGSTAILVSVLLNFCSGSLKFLKESIHWRDINIAMVLIYGVLNFSFYLLNLTFLKVIDFDNFGEWPYGAWCNWTGGNKCDLCLPYDDIMSTNPNIILWGMILGAPVAAIMVYGLVKCVLCTSVNSISNGSPEVYHGCSLCIFSLAALPVFTCLGLILAGVVTVIRINVFNHIQYSFSVDEFFEVAYHLKIQLYVTSVTSAILFVCGIAAGCNRHCCGCCNQDNLLTPLNRADINI